jgi:mono/diheme cytochrome c family protein
MLAGAVLGVTAVPGAVAGQTMKSQQWGNPARRPVVGRARSALAAQAMKSQWDGVYSLEQAKRGETLYAEHCAPCHGTDLTGGEMSPALAGGEFLANWNELTVGDLFQRIRISMPPNAPNAIGRAQKTDVLAFILYKGDFPTGQADLPNEMEVLKTIRLLATKPGAN